MNAMQHAPFVPESRHALVQRGGGLLSVRQWAGRGPAFVLMHGFPDNQHIYDHLVAHLVAAGRAVVSFDFLGFGASDKPAGARYDFGQQLEDLRVVVDDLAQGPVVPVAHDSAGPAALNFALAHPDKVAGVVLLNCLYAQSPTLRHPEFIELFASPSLRALTGAMLQSPEHFAWILRFQRDRFQTILTDEHRERYASFLGPLIDSNFRDPPGSGPAFAQMTAALFPEEAANADRQPGLSHIDVPVRLVWGQRDPYLNVGVAEDIRRHLPHASLHLIEAGHWVQIDAPEETAAAMLGPPLP
jgi:haloalkane dehalogenase